jgi:hypothetical protein
LPEGGLAHVQAPGVNTLRSDPTPADGEQGRVRPRRGPIWHDDEAMARLLPTTCSPLCEAPSPPHAGRVTGAPGGYASSVERHRDPGIGR